MLIEELIYEVNLPEGVSFSIDNNNVKLSGSRGDLNRDFKHPQISISEDNGNIKLTGKKLRRKEKALIGTWRAHLKNMAQGVSSGFLYEMKIVFAGDSIIKIISEVIEVTLDDQGEAWDTKNMPKHKEI